MRISLQHLPVDQEDADKHSGDLDGEVKLGCYAFGDSQ